MVSAKLPESRVSRMPQPDLVHVLVELVHILPLLEIGDCAEFQGGEPVGESSGVSQDEHRCFAFSPGNLAQYIKNSLVCVTRVIADAWIEYDNVMPSLLQIGYRRGSTVCSHTLKAIVVQMIDHLRPKRLVTFNDQNTDPLSDNPLQRGNVRDAG